MGMYTRLTFWAEIDVDAWTCFQGYYDGMDDPELGWMSKIHGRSAYHETQGTYLTRQCGSWILQVDASFKNYNDEVGQFLAWIHPHVKSRDVFVGFHIYEEAETPVLIYWTRDGFIEDYVAPPAQLGEIPWGGR